MRNTYTNCVALLLFAAVANFACAEEPVLLLMPEPPEGMSVTKTPLKANDEVVGYHVQVANQEGVGKVIIQIETKGDRTAKQQRLEGLKGYVNGLANGLKGAGFELETSNVPNLKTADFTKQLRVEMRFQKDESTQLLVRQFIYFTDKGYNVQVLANTEQELEQLSRWAQHIRPADSIPAVAWRGQTPE